MSLSHGRPYLAIPGPSVIPDRVLAAMMRPAPNIYAGPLTEMMEGLVADLCAVARTAGHVAIYIANGHGAWEAALANTCTRGDRLLVLATGSFGHGWAEVAARMGLAAEVIEAQRGMAHDLAALTGRLADDTHHAIRAVLVTHVDTATSVKTDVAAVRAALDAAGHPALLMADCIASLACDRFEMDAWGVDVMVAASQKGLMCPPGLGFVYFNDRADAARATAGLVMQYWDWRPRARPERFYEYFGGTAPTHHLFALREALNMLLREEGLEVAWARHAQLARAIWAACEAWGAGEGTLRLTVADPADRSHAVTSLSLPSPNGTALRDWVEREVGVTLGIGLGMADPGDPAWHGFFRIAHMGHVNAHMVLGALGAMEAGMQALGIPHGPDAMEAAARVVAGRG